MSSKEFCESGKHSYREKDVVQSIFPGQENNAWIVVACSKCDSQFLRLVERPIP